MWFQFLLNAIIKKSTAGWHNNFVMTLRGCLRDWIVGVGVCWFSLRLIKPTLVTYQWKHGISIWQHIHRRECSPWLLPLCCAAARAWRCLPVTLHVNPGFLNLGTRGKRYQLLAARKATLFIKWPSYVIGVQDFWNQFEMLLLNTLDIIVPYCKFVNNSIKCSPPVLNIK